MQEKSHFALINKEILNKEILNKEILDKEVCMFKWLMLFVYIILSTYMLWRMIHWFKIVIPLFKHKRMQAVWIGLYCVFASTIFLGVFLPRSSIQVMIHKISNVWLGFFIYLLFFMIIGDIIVLILKLVDKKKSIPMLRSLYGALIIGISITAASVGFTIYGTIHARHMTTRSYEIYADKQTDNLDSLNIVLVADLHLGYSIGCDDMEKMVERINELNPDVVIYAGDIFDNDYDALDDPKRLEAIIRGVNSKYGSYAVFGNHDVTETLVGGFSTAALTKAFRDPRMESFLKEAGVNIMLDEVTTIADGRVELIGRLDGEKAGDGTNNRKELSELIEQCDSSKPLIVINHEPDELHKAADMGVDVLLSGHTHAGQFFPLTIIQPLAWENYWGIKKIDNMYSVVTSGVGLYGPAMRVGTDSEVVSVRIKFNQNRVKSEPG